ncbi:MAG: methyltransferase domain-containing protein [Vicinamibacterales bacterium]
MISEALLEIVRCPDCKGTLQVPGAGSHGVRVPGAEVPGASVLRCADCGREYQSPADFLDLRPREQYVEQTKYLDEALHLDARHERVSPPLLGSKIRNDMLRAFLAPQPGELVADLGCGSGRALLWNRDLGATTVGIDIAPFFSRDARSGIDLMLADLRKLPFGDHTFDKAWSLDVLEHLSIDALHGMLAEANRVLKPGGSLFVYTHVRKNAAVATGLKWINRFAKTLEHWDLIDLRQEHLRKSDHLNPLRDIPHLEQVAAETGFRISRIRYYTPLVGGLVENIMMRVAERAMARRAAGRIAATGGSAEDADAAAVREARTSAKERIASSPTTYGALRALSFAMKLDLVLFGRITSGPFFALLTKDAGSGVKD